MRYSSVLALAAGVLIEAAPAIQGRTKAAQSWNNPVAPSAWSVSNQLLNGGNGGWNQLSSWEQSGQNGSPQGQTVTRAPASISKYKSKNKRAQLKPRNSEMEEEAAPSGHHLERRQVAATAATALPMAPGVPKLWTSSVSIASVPIPANSTVPAAAVVPKATSIPATLVPVPVSIPVPAPKATVPASIPVPAPKATVPASIPVPAPKATIPASIPVPVPKATVPASIPVPVPKAPVPTPKVVPVPVSLSSSPVVVPVPVSTPSPSAPSAPSAPKATAVPTRATVTITIPAIPKATAASPKAASPPKAIPPKGTPQVTAASPNPSPRPPKGISPQPTPAAGAFSSPQDDEDDESSFGDGGRFFPPMPKPFGGFGSYHDEDDD